MSRIFNSTGIAALFLAALLLMFSCGTGNISTNKEARQRDKARNLRGGCCFTGDTRILMADGSERPICNLNMGEQVVSYNTATGKLEASTVMGIVQVQHDNLVEYVFESGTVRATNDHPFYIQGKGWSSSDPAATKQYFNFRHRKLGTIQQGDLFFLISENGQLEPQTLQEIRTIEGDHTTYSIVHLSKNEAYFANGMLTGVEEIAVRVTEIP